MDFSPGHNFQGIETSNFKLDTQIDHIKDKTIRAVYKNHNSIPVIFGVISLCKFLLQIFVRGITSKV